MAYEVRTRWDLARNVLRLYYTIPFVLASVTGAAFALTITDDWLLALLIPLDVFLLALFVNLSNDYFDHKSGADQKRFQTFDPAYEAELKQIFNDKYYWMGNTFDKGEITERQGKAILAIIAVAAALIALPIIYYGGWVVLVMGAVAFFLSYFYTAPPLNLGARGFGELDVFLSFALMSYFTFYVIVPELNWEMVIIAITVGIAVMLMRAVDQMSGYDAHKAAGEKDFSVRFGQEGSARITVWLLGVMYVLCGASGGPFRPALPGAVPHPPCGGAHGQDVPGQGGQVPLGAACARDAQDRHRARDPGGGGRRHRFRRRELYHGLTGSFRRIILNRKKATTTTIRTRSAAKK